MKIGIYGDSYADASKDKKDVWFNVLIRLLEQDKTIPKNSIVDNYAKGGSSLHFSYKKFLETKDKYDLILFLATEPHRYPIAFQPSWGGASFHITSIPHVDAMLNMWGQQLTAEDRFFLENLKGWFNASNQDYNREVADIILDKIEESHHNIIVYPCFSESFSMKRFKKHGLDSYIHPLHSFWHRQLELLNIDPNDFSAMEKNTIACHLTSEFNVFFGNVLYKKIKTGKWDHTGFFDIKIEMPKNYYYKNWD